MNKEDIKEITTGKGTNNPEGNDPKNIISINMNLCADSRKETCPYYIKIKLDTKYLSFEQGFCGFNFKK